MKVQRDLRNHLRQYFPRELHAERNCTCGSPNHARILLFRVNGLPASAIVPEGYELSAALLSGALAGARVEPISESELDAIFSETEMGHTGPFESPFGAAVYLDQNLLQFKSLVFCPKMLAGETGECFRVPIADFQALEHPVVLQLSPPAPPASGSAAW